MMRRFVFCLMVGAFALLVTANAQAGQRAEAFTLSPMAGYHVFEGDQAVEDAASYGLSLGYNLNKHWAIEGDLRYTPTETDIPNVKNEDLDVWSFGLSALYHFQPDAKLVPYLVAGFGGMVFELDKGRDDEDFMMNYGAGVKYFFSDDMALRLDARHVVDFISDRNFDHPRGDDVDHNFVAMAGLMFQFGGVTPPPPPPADSDRDGIPDIRDKCPDTPFGTPVDAVGCPPMEKPKPAPKPAPVPVDGDDDGDGVKNSRDKCPGTPKGIIVDEHGCPIKYTLHIEFDFDKDEVRPQYHEDLVKAAEFINQYPEAQFLVAGHTDNYGTDEYNEVLSKKRAAAVKKYLVEKFGIAAQLLYPRGYGEKQPIATNATDAGRQKNRRVEIICCVVIPEE